MKKILLTLFIVAASVFTCFAQNTDSFSMGVDVGVPEGPLSNFYSYTAGISLKYELATHLKPLKLVASAGYTVFSQNTNVKKAAKADFIPLSIGGKYYIHKFYAEGDIGASTNLNSQAPSSRIALLYAPSIGYNIDDVLESDQIDLGIGYQARVQTGGTLGQIFLHVVYKFNF